MLGNIFSFRNARLEKHPTPPSRVIIENIFPFLYISHLTVHWRLLNLEAYLTFNSFSCKES